MNRSIYRSLTILSAALLLGGCEEFLTVNNPNSGDATKVLKTPADVENLLGGYYKRWHSGVYGSITNLEGMASNLSFMSYSSLANNCLNNHTPFTGATNFNSPGNTCKDDQVRLYQFMAEVNRVASIVLGRMNAGVNLGTPGRNLRARAFAEFLSGISIGYSAMMHDSLSVVNGDNSSQDVPALIDYREAIDSAVSAFDRALAAANDPAANGPDGFPLPATWIPSPTSFTSANFVRLIHSFRARIVANSARTLAERAALDWNAIIADVDAGITASHQITTNTVSGPSHGGWRNQFVGGLWHQMPPFWIGMADNSGSYLAWLNTPLGDRGAGNTGFFMVTPDLRFPQGGSRGAQQADFAITSCSGASQTCLRYFVNRPAGSDQYAGSGFGWSNYDHVRHTSWRLAGAGTARNGPTIDIPLAEMNLLKAEGLFHLGTINATALGLVNASRTAAGLPALVALDNTTPVPGGVDCVPKVPPTATCGTFWEALKYEKRIETMFMHYAATFLDERGWDGLPQGTPLYWATPYQDLQARSYPVSAIYGVGLGVGNAPNSAAGPSVYGW